MIGGPSESQGYHFKQCSKLEEDLVNVQKMGPLPLMPPHPKKPKQNKETVGLKKKKDLRTQKMKVKNKQVRKNNRKKK